MKKLITSFLLLFALVATPTKADSFAHTAIAPLSTFGKGITCTTWSLNESKHYWATAAHCVADLSDHFFIQGDSVIVLDRFEEDDLAILKTAQGAKALPLALNQPSIGDRVSTSGYPLGNPNPVASFGQVMALRAEVPIDEGGPFAPPVRHEYSLFTMPIAPGHSGSPVIAQSGVVSIIQIGGGGFAGGLEWRKLVRDTAKYRK